MADLALVASTFGELLHRAGLPTTPERSGRFAQAIVLADPATVDELYWAARVTLVTGRDQLDVFDRVFDQVFRGLADPAEARGDQASTLLADRPPHPEPAGRPDHRPHAPSPGELPSGRPSAGSRPAGADDEPGQPRMMLALASREERLAATDFAELDPAELAELQRLMRGLRLSPPLRPGRRPRRHRRGDRLDVRATLRRSRRTGGDPVVQIRRKRHRRRRRVVVLCDISGSMQAYARAYVQFLHAAAGSSRAEVFTFATRLTRLTRALAVPHPQAALARAAVAAPDWHGGTRIGEALKAFLDRYGRRGLARGAVVVILSDGWERDDPSLLAEQMARLRRLAHRIVWINPRSADARFQPLAGGMAAALPFCDTLVSGHSVAALSQVVAAIGA